MYYPNSIDTVGGNAMTNAIVNQNPQLKKTSGWRSLTAESLDGNEFSILSGSKAKDAGISIASYNNRIVAADYTDGPHMVMKSTDSTPDIGAWMNSNAQTNNIPPPTDLYYQRPIISGFRPKPQELYSHKVPAKRELGECEPPQGRPWTIVA